MKKDVMLVIGAGQIGMVISPQTSMEQVERGQRSLLLTL